jgi:hypothetical protein
MAYIAGGMIVDPDASCEVNYIAQAFTLTLHPIFNKKAPGVIRGLVSCIPCLIIA